MATRQIIGWAMADHLKAELCIGEPRRSKGSYARLHQGVLHSAALAFSRLQTHCGRGVRTVDKPEHHAARSVML
jgi:hypothetical protein